MRAVLRIGCLMFAPIAISFCASLIVIVDLKRLHALCIAFVLAGSSGDPPRLLGRSSSMTVAWSWGQGALGLRGWPHRAQWVAVALMRATSCRRRWPLALWAGVRRAMVVGHRLGLHGVGIMAGPVPRSWPGYCQSQVVSMATRVWVMASRAWSMVSWSW